jgi:Ser/Thr protein kinase RdoA (MazF antagonist)
MAPRRKVCGNAFSFALSLVVHPMPPPALTRAPTASRSQWCMTPPSRLTAVRRYTGSISTICCVGRSRVQDSGLVENQSAIAELEAIASRTAKTIEFLDLTTTHCHGDCHGFNARITDAGIAAFFDFDDGGPGYLAYDLSVFLWAKVSFGRKLYAMWDAFIEGYRTIRPIAPNDFEAAHTFVIVRHIWLMGEYASRRKEWGTEPVGWIAREIEFLKAWEAKQTAERLL